jgi:hypothetical protein
MAFDTFDTDPVPTAGITFSGGNLTALGGATALAASAMAQTREGKTSGLCYVEFTCNAVSGNVDGVGVTNATAGFEGYNSGFLGSDLGSHTWGYFTNGHIVNNNAAVTAVNNTTYGAGDVIGIAIDFTNQKIWFRKNTGGWIGTSGTPNPATNTGGFSVANLMSSRVYPVINNSGALAKFTANFGATSFTGSVPSGFTAGWTNTTAGTYFGSFANNGKGTSVSLPPSNSKAVSKYAATLTGNVSSVVLVWSQFTPIQGPTKAVIYADSSGAPGALLGTSTNTISSGAGEQVFTFSGVNIVSGTSYWVGVDTGTYSGAMAIWCPAQTNGVQYNSGAYPTPSNPFGASPSTVNFRYPAIINVSPPVANRRSMAQVCG